MKQETVKRLDWLSGALALPPILWFLAIAAPDVGIDLGVTFFRVWYTVALGIGTVCICKIEMPLIARFGSLLAYIPVMGTFLFLIALGGV
jgi:hypothetical protein